MTALGKLFRTTAFKLSIAYLIVFAILAGAVMFWVSSDMRRVIDEQVEATIEAEIKGVSLNRGQLSKAVKVARLLNDSAKVLTKYENNQILSFEALYGMCPKKATSRTKTKMDESKAWKVLLSSKAFKALPKVSRDAIRKARK